MSSSTKAERLIDSYLAEKLTRGIRNALEKAGGVKVCSSCRLMVPRYPGRYPQKCPECGDELEDLQNAPTYSESLEEGWRQKVVDFYIARAKEQGLDYRDDTHAYNAQMRRIPKDRIPS